MRLIRGRPLPFSLVVNVAWLALLIWAWRVQGLAECNLQSCDSAAPPHIASQIIAVAAVLFGGASILLLARVAWRPIAALDLLFGGLALAGTGTYLLTPVLNGDWSSWAAGNLPGYASLVIFGILMLASGRAVLLDRSSVRQQRAATVAA